MSWMIIEETYELKGHERWNSSTQCITKHHTHPQFHWIQIKKKEEEEEEEELYLLLFLTLFFFQFLSFTINWDGWISRNGIVNPIAIIN